MIYDAVQKCPAHRTDAVKNWFGTDIAAAKEPSGKLWGLVHLEVCNASIAPTLALFQEERIEQTEKHSIHNLLFSKLDLQLFHCHIPERRCEIVH